MNEITVPERELAQFCQQNHIQKLAFFGSVLTEQFNEASDIDVLIEFQPDHIPGLIDFVGMEIELTKLLERQVDLHTPQSLSPYFRDKVVAESQIQYVA